MLLSDPASIEPVCQALRLVVSGAPEIDDLAADLEEDFIQMPTNDRWAVPGDGGANESRCARTSAPITTQNWTSKVTVTGIGAAFRSVGQLSRLQRNDFSSNMKDMSDI
ncbi:hypothetical protein [Tropicimonas sp. IMCC6043]|uniref:hypothetical protein n=1 Tax=Tropicimonas sp. IMCC6043 TaxID=2510645 RepID=UPI0013EBACD3|nr:hypothetical protein [Tropicimonas sp. IMCC6043]